MKFEVVHKIHNAIVDVKIGDFHATGIDQITNRGLEVLASFLATPLNYDKAVFAFVGIGAGELDVSSEDRVMENEKWRKEGVVTYSQNVYIVNVHFTKDEPSDPFWLREVALWDKHAGGVMGVRWALDEFYYMDGEDVVDLTCRLTLN